MSSNSTRMLAIARAREVERGCFVTGLRVMHGHKVSNSNIKTKRIFKQNLSSKSIFSEALGMQRVKISRKGERTIHKYGGLDRFLENYKKRKMTLAAINMRKKLLSTKETTATA